VTVMRDHQKYFAVEDAAGKLAPYFLVVGRAAIWVAPSELRSRFYQGLDLLHREQQHM